MDLKRNSVIALFLKGKSQPAIVQELQHMNVDALYVSAAIERYNGNAPIEIPRFGVPQITETSSKRTLARNQRQSAQRIARNVKVKQVFNLFSFLRLFRFPLSLFRFPYLISFVSPFRWFWFQVFSTEDEAALVSYVKKCSSTHNHYLSPTEVRELAYQFAKEICVDVPQNWEQEKKAGKSWYFLFRTRYPSLNERTQEQISGHLSESTVEEKSVDLEEESVELDEKGAGIPPKRKPSVKTTSNASKRAKTNVSSTSSSEDEDSWLLTQKPRILDTKNYKLEGANI